MSWQQGDLDLGGVRIHYYRRGSGRPLVLAHGMSDSGECWTRVAEALESDFDIVAYDARFHGLSDATPGVPFGRGGDLLGVIDGLGLVERIILSRPAVEAGERLGFLPGDMREKVDPYLRPLYDALDDVLPPEKVERDIELGVIEIAPLAFMRGRTLANAFVILDEAQNTTPMQMKMFLTRLGENSKMVITGDPSQIDLPPGVKSGLDEAVNLLSGVPGIEAVRFSQSDVVRRDLVARIVEAYDRATGKTG